MKEIESYAAKRLQSLTVVPVPVAAGELPKERQYTPAILACWARIGFREFRQPVEMYPWSGRNLHIARRLVFSKYIEPDDVLNAVWVEEQAKRNDQDWRTSAH